MKKNEIEEGRIITHSKGVGTLTREDVESRARELALINGRSADQISDSDRQQAKRELTGEEGLVPTETAAEALPESARWDPTPVSTGRHVGPVQQADEQTDAERLTEQGLAEAEHDRMVEATKQQGPSDYEEKLSG
jgi:hypothetical protein